MCSILNEIAENRFVVVTDHAHFFDGGDFCDGGETVPNNGMTSNFEERLWITRVSQTSKEKNVNIHTFGRSKDNGLKRVPLDGPPT